jgi:uncharacterized protein YdhG (YjbR/CyaY superfamily)
MEQHQINTVDAYRESIPASFHDTFDKLRTWIMECAPQAIETMSYGMPTYVYYGNLVHFAYQKKHIGFYPGPTGVLYALDQNPNLQYSKGAIRFSYKEDIPYQLMKDIILYRIKENEQSYVMKQAMKKQTK